MNRIWQRRQGISGVFLGLMFAGALLAADSGQGVKLIEYGWDVPKSDYLRQHWQEMENTTPFDGVVFVVDALDEQGKTNSSTRCWDKSPWKRAWLNQAAADLAACQFKKFTDNFILLNMGTPGPLDWFDDAGWQAMAEKAGHLAWLAKIGKCKGICLDPESYSGPKQFLQYDGAKGHTFEETCAMARKRGAQLMTAMGKEYPDLTLISFYLFSSNFVEVENPQDALADSIFGLLPAVVNGFLDALPPAAKLVDATENAYNNSDEISYLRCYNKIHKPGWLLAPENRAKYAAQVSAGFGFYLDAYLNPPGSYYIDPGNGSRLQSLRQNLALALKISDGYVWAYGEQCKWWPIICANIVSQKSVGKGRLWEEAMPGIKQAIEQVRDPLAAAVKAIAAGKAAKTLKNLAINPDFESEQTQTSNSTSPQPPGWKAASAPAGYSTWQISADRPEMKAKDGFLIWDRAVGCNSQSSAKAVKVDAGCFIQKIVVKPGEAYVVEVDTKKQGQGRAGMTIRWLDPRGKWTARDCGTPINFMHTGQDWAHGFGVVTVPDGAGFLVVILEVAEQNTENDICWFDNLGVYRLD